MDVQRNGNVSFWYADDEVGGIPDYRRALPGDCDADVCIVGAGFTGLWTAYYLRKADPSIRVVIVEREFAGFGASGRNGGWLSGGFGWSREKYLKTSTRGAVVDMQRAMAGTVDEVISVAAAEGIDADIVRADNMKVAVNPPQLERIKAEHADYLDWETPADRVALLSRAEARARVNVANTLGAFIIRGMARVQPAKLARGLAVAVERLGVPIYEQTEVTAICKGKATTSRGGVRAPIIIRATEGFTPGLPGYSRAVLPLNSALIVTEPLSPHLWKDIGWESHELLCDAAHDFFYAQRTREDRIAIGGRGVPYRFGSRTDSRGKTQQATIDRLRGILHRTLPQVAASKIQHAWCGVLGVPRDWCTSVGLDPSTGMGWAGGYVGLGVSSSNLAARTLRDLILRRDTDLTRLAWVNRKVRRWEPEPFRWLGVNAMYQLYRIADRREAAGLQHTSRLATFADRITGR